MAESSIPPELRAMLADMSEKLDAITTWQANHDGRHEGFEKTQADHGKTLYTRRDGLLARVDHIDAVQASCPARTATARPWWSEVGLAILKTVISGLILAAIAWQFAVRDYIRDARHAETVTPPSLSGPNILKPGHAGGANTP